MNRKRWAPQEISLLRKYYPKLRIKDLAGMFLGRTKATIVVKASELKLLSAKLWQSSENDMLQKHFALLSKKELSKLLPKRTWPSILAQGERLGLKRKTNKPTLKVNEHYFKKWSANVAYILGFIIADGNITKITHNGYSDKLGFGLHKKDMDVLKKIKRELSAKQALSLSGNYVHLSIFSQVIVDDLKKLGVTYRKSFHKKRCELPNVPKKYIRDFIRGIVDGDGSIHFDKRRYPTISICGRKEVMVFVRNHFLSKFKVYSRVGQPRINGGLSNVFYICYRCNSAKILVNYLYGGANLYLKRKFKLAQQCHNTKIKRRENYSQKEKQIIQKNYPSLPKETILSILPNRNWPSIQRHAWSLGVYKYNIKNDICS